MKKLLIGLMILGSFSVMASEVDNCTFYFSGDRSESKVIKVMTNKGYVEAHNEESARLIVSSTKFQSNSGYYYAGVTVHDSESKKRVFSEEKRGSGAFFSVSLSRLIKRLERTFPECK